MGGNFTSRKKEARMSHNMDKDTVIRKGIDLMVEGYT
jgi:hypothetical protein